MGKKHGKVFIHTINSVKRQSYDFNGHYRWSSSTNTQIVKIPYGTNVQIIPKTYQDQIVQEFILLTITT